MEEFWKKWRFVSQTLEGNLDSERQGNLKKEKKKIVFGSCILIFHTSQTHTDHINISLVHGCIIFFPKETIWLGLIPVIVRHWR